MIRILYLLILTAVTSQSAMAEFIKATLVYVNGKSINGYAEFPDEPSSEYIIYKASEKADKEKIPSTQLETVKFTFKNNEILEIDRIATWQYGAKMTKKISPPVWLTVIKRGYVTLYGATVGGSVVNSSRGASINPSDTYCFVKKKVEKEATVIHYKMDATISVMKNRMFFTMGQEYFADYPDLVAKIKNKEYTYKDLVKVVDEYNSWVRK
jgi:hypothetical protein